MEDQRKAYLKKTKRTGTAEMAQSKKVLVTQGKELILVPSTHTEKLGWWCTPVIPSVSTWELNCCWCFQVLGLFTELESHGIHRPAEVSKGAYRPDNQGSAVKNRDWVSNEMKSRLTPGPPQTCMCAVACMYLHSHTLHTYRHVLKLSSSMRHSVSRGACCPA